MAQHNFTTKRFDTIRKAQGLPSAVKAARAAGIPGGMGGRRLRFPTGGSRLTAPRGAAGRTAQRRRRWKRRTSSFV